GPGENPMLSRFYVLIPFLLVLVGAATILAAQQLLRPAGRGGVGGWRAAGLAQLMAPSPVHQGEEACARCHGEIAELHSKDIHFGVQCEVCHGPGSRHVAYHEDSATNPGLADEASLSRQYTREGCLYCHRKLASRPSTFPQIDPVEHYAFLHVTDPRTRCIECHSPHEPLFLLARADEARIHPVIFECRDCHEGRPARDPREVAHHPAIFLCRDCHAEIAADAGKREHAFMECTGCHQFYRESESAGRIFKNGNRRFCLLCHAQRPFKDAERLPQIEGEAHIAEMAELAELELAKLASDSRACLQCHLDFIHDSGLFKRPKG
ncbi:MAG: hypothetical protein AB1486_29915, partial [Planctomycetota bacterium]